MAPLNSPKEKMSEARISTLTNAAKISCYIDGLTIGPRSVTKDFSSKKEETQPNDDNNNNNSTKPHTPVAVVVEKSRWRTDVWRSVDANQDDEEPSGYNIAPRNTLTLHDCKAVRFSMALRSAEKLQRAEARKEHMKRLSKYDELCARLEQFKIDSTQQALSNVRKKQLANEEAILEAVRRLDEEARVVVEEHQKTMEEQNRQRTERTNRLRREEEIRSNIVWIKSLKNLFIVAFEKYVKSILQNQQHLSNYAEYVKHQEQALARYEQILNVVNSGHISATEVAALENTCDNLKEMQNKVDEEVAQNSERLNRMMADQAAEAQKKQQQELADKQQQQLEQQQKLQAASQNVSVIPLPSAPADAVDNSNNAQQLGVVNVPRSNFVNSERLTWYSNIMCFYEEYAQSVKPLQSDDNMKQFRFNCQKAVNIPLNSISSVSAQHLQDKFDKLAQILSGMPVKVGEDVQIASSSHPLGVRFCTLLIAKKLVSLADLAVASHPQSAFPIAAMIVAIWQRFPDTGNLFLAYLYKECPYLVPYFIPQSTGQSVEEYLKIIGHRYENGVLEKADKYLKRQSGLIRLYAAILVSKTRRGQTLPNPHSIDNGWIWLVNMLNLDPLPDICATLIHEFLVICGSEMFRVYGKQFHKLLIAIYQQYLVKLNKVDEGGPKNRLEVLLHKILQESSLEPPQGLLPHNFW